MRIIQRQISLEPMTSRLPSVWPAYYDNNPNIYYFDDESLKAYCLYQIDDIINETKQKKR